MAADAGVGKVKNLGDCKSPSQSVPPLTTIGFARAQPPAQRRACEREVVSMLFRDESAVKLRLYHGGRVVWLQLLKQFNCAAAVEQ